MKQVLLFLTLAVHIKSLKTLDDLAYCQNEEVDINRIKRIHNSKFIHMRDRKISMDPKDFTSMNHQGNIVIVDEIVDDQALQDFFFEKSFSENFENQQKIKFFSNTIACRHEKIESKDKSKKIVIYRVLKDCGPLAYFDVKGYKPREKIIWKIFMIAQLLSIGTELENQNAINISLNPNSLVIEKNYKLILTDYRKIARVDANKIVKTVPFSGPDAEAHNKHENHLVAAVHKAYSTILKSQNFIIGSLILHLVISTDFVPLTSFMKQENELQLTFTKLTEIPNKEIIDYTRIPSEEDVNRKIKYFENDVKEYYAPLESYIELLRNSGDTIDDIIESASFESEQKIIKSKNFIFFNIYPILSSLLNENQDERMELKEASNKFNEIAKHMLEIYDSEVKDLPNGELQLNPLKDEKFSEFTYKMASLKTFSESLKNNLNGQFEDSFYAHRISTLLESFYKIIQAPKADSKNATSMRVKEINNTKIEETKDLVRRIFESHDDNNGIQSLNNNIL